MLLSRPGGGGQKYGQILCWEKKDWKGIKKGEKMHIFIDLKFKKLQKRLENFRRRRAPTNCNKFPLGKRYDSRRGGGAKNEFQI